MPKQAKSTIVKGKKSSPAKTNKKPATKKTNTTNNKNKKAKKETSKPKVSTKTTTKKTTTTTTTKKTTTTPSTAVVTPTKTTTTGKNAKDLTQTQSSAVVATVQAAQKTKAKATKKQQQPPAVAATTKAVAEKVNAKKSKDTSSKSKTSAAKKKKESPKKKSPSKKSKKETVAAPYVAPSNVVAALPSTFVVEATSPSSASSSSPASSSSSPSSNKASNNTQNQNNAKSATATGSEGQVRRVMDKKVISFDVPTLKNAVDKVIPSHKVTIDIEKDGVYSAHRHMMRATIKTDRKTKRSFYRTGKSGKFIVNASDKDGNNYPLPHCECGVLCQVLVVSEFGNEYIKEKRQRFYNSDFVMYGATFNDTSGRPYYCCGMKTKDHKGCNTFAWAKASRSDNCYT